MPCLALVGDYSPEITAHRAIPRALELARAALAADVSWKWIHTSALRDAPRDLAGCAAIWVVPGSPYARLPGALAAIRFARETRRPFLGTCGGFQHGLIEHARHVLGMADADHAESNPAATLPLIARLSCSLVERTARLRLRDGSALRSIYGSAVAEEQYHCNYGLNPAYVTALEGGPGLRVSATDDAGEVRAVELIGHPFFIATLFQPERSGLRATAHPLVTAFLKAAAATPRTRCMTAMPSDNGTGYRHDSATARRHAG